VAVAVAVAELLSEAEPLSDVDGLVGGVVVGEAGGFVWCVLVGVGETDAGAEYDVIGCTGALYVGVGVGLGLAVRLGLTECVAGTVVACWVVVLPTFDAGAVPLWLVPR